MNKTQACIISSIFLVVSFPVAFNHTNFIPQLVSNLVVWIQWVPLLMALRKSSPKENFYWGYATGFVSHAGILFWITIATQKYGGLSVLLSFCILISAVAVLSFFPAMMFWLIAKMPDVKPRWFYGALIFSLVVWSQDFLPFQGFPWTSPAYSLYDVPLLTQLAEVTGMFGLHVLIFFSNFVIAEFIQNIRNKKPLPWKGVLCLVLSITVSMIFGAIRLTQLNPMKPHSPVIQAALLQGNIAQDDKWIESSRANIIKIYDDLSQKAGENHVSLIIWPEASFPQTLNRDIRYFPSFLSHANNATFLIGAPTYYRKNNKMHYLNSAFVIHPENRMIQARYDKHYLVPFGEYVPFSDILPMHWIVPPVAGNFSKGSHPNLGQVQNHPFGILICYEALFSRLSTQLVRQGAQFLVNITNDAWFDYTSGPFQHFQFSSFRAIETRRTVLRAANTGLSAWFDVTGKAHQTTTLFTKSLVLVPIVPQTNLTFYVQYPWLFPVIAFIYVAIIACTSWIRKKRNEQKPKK